jgi:4a-hydroxytetrahydrobiopterin dehydratase
VDCPDGWAEVDGALQREFRFRDFAGALAFVNRVGALAEQVDHHPDVALHWNRVTLRWWTHTREAVTDRDAELARRTNELEASDGASYALPLVPMLRVEDADGSVGFYTELLGFEIVERLERDGRLARARLVHGAAELIVTEQRGEVRTNPGEGPILCLYPDDVEALHASLRNLGVTVGELRRGEDGTSEFELVDPDGYELWFGPPSRARA